MSRFICVVENTRLGDLHLSIVNGFTGGSSFLFS